VSAHKAVLKLRGVQLHGENLKIGKDVQGTEKGKCACGKCEGQMKEKLKRK